jgi:toxin ParE1/3/4
MKVTFTPRAIGDLREIADYIAERSTKGAFAVGRRIEEVLAKLSGFPRMGRPLEGRPSVRVVSLGRYPYLLFYTVEPDEILILHIRHAARRPAGPGEV